MLSRLRDYEMDGTATEVDGHKTVIKLDCVLKTMNKEVGTIISWLLESHCSLWNALVHK